MTRTLTDEEQVIAAGMSLSGDVPSEVAYRFGIGQGEARALMANDPYGRIPRVVWDPEQADEHPTLDLMFYIDHDVIHLMQGNDRTLDHVHIPVARLDALIAAIKEQL